MRTHIRAALLLAMIVAGTVLGSLPAQASSTAAKSGGSVTVGMVNITWPGLDPATDTVEATHNSIMDAIYGELFAKGPSNTFTPDLASGYTYSPNHLTVTITIRSHVKFQDGTPFTAQAVAENFNRVLEPQYACLCATSFTDLKSVTARGDKVLVTLTSPDSELIAAINDEAPDWVPSPTALATEPEATFAQHPIGAGPFEVVSNVPSSTLTLQKNPGYWEKGHPLLSTLIFENIPNDQSEYAALESGSIQMAAGITTLSVIDEARSQYNVQLIPGVDSYDVQFNTNVAPFNQLAARQAVTYATDPAQMVSALYPNFATVSESPSGPASSFFQKKVPGYDSYNLTKAEALVKQLGGLTFTLASNNSPVSIVQDEAIQQQMQKAGMNVSIEDIPQGNFSSLELGQKWQAIQVAVGAAYPGTGIDSVERRLGGASPDAGTHDLAIDGLMNQAIQFINPATETRVLYKLYQYLAKNAYVDILFSTPEALIASKSLVNWKSEVGSLGSGNIDTVWPDLSTK
jgi:peptide/nickel transport system substrate-binding protein